MVYFSSGRTYYSVQQSTEWVVWRAPDFETTPWLSRGHLAQRMDTIQVKTVFLDPCGWKRVNQIIPLNRYFVFFQSYGNLLPSLIDLNHTRIREFYFICGVCFVFHVEVFPGFWDRSAGGFRQFVSERDIQKWSFRTTLDALLLYDWIVLWLNCVLW